MKGGSEQSMLALNDECRTIPRKAREYRFLAPALPTIVFDSYWHLAAERQRIFFARLRGEPFPWSQDPILQAHKFTNAYRASDRVSQYLISEVIYKGSQSPEEVTFRTLLFKLFNRIETWDRLSRHIGPLSWHEFRPDAYAAVLDAAMAEGERVYSAAYIMPSGGRQAKPSRKHTMHLSLLDRMMREDLSGQIQRASSMEEAFTILRGYPTIGDFLAYQYVTDLNYGPHLNFTEMEFVIPGPGARDGIQKCFADTGGLTEPELIRLVAQHQRECMKVAEVDFRDLWGRPLQLIDCQNLFCEVSKYARVAHPEVAGRTGRTRIKQLFSPGRKLPAPWFPPKWNLNSSIKEDLPDVSNRSIKNR
jgi:hypothetical protein